MGGVIGYEAGQILYDSKICSSCAGESCGIIRENADGATGLCPVAEIIDMKRYDVVRHMKRRP